MTETLHRVSKDGVTMPKLPSWWKKELEKVGCQVGISRPEKHDNYYGSITPEGKPEQVLMVSLDKCHIYVRYHPDFNGDPQWQVYWDVDERKDPGQADTEDDFVVGILGRVDDDDDETTAMSWYASNECDSLVEVQRSINEWLWCVRHFNKVRRMLLEDMFLKEFRVAGCTLDVNPFPTEPQRSYELATIRYGDTRIKISYDPSSEKWRFDGSVRKCSFKNPNGMLKSLHKRARRFLKGDY